MDIVRLSISFPLQQSPPLPFLLFLSHFIYAMVGRWYWLDLEFTNFSLSMPLSICLFIVISPSSPEGALPPPPVSTHLLIYPLTLSLKFLHDNMSSRLPLCCLEISFLLKRLCYYSPSCSIFRSQLIGRIYPLSDLNCELTYTPSYTEKFLFLTPAPHRTGKMAILFIFFFMFLSILDV